MSPDPPTPPFNPNLRGDYDQGQQTAFENNRLGMSNSGGNQKQWGQNNWNGSQLIDNWAPGKHSEYVSYGEYGGQWVDVPNTVAKVNLPALPNLGEPPKNGTKSIVSAPGPKVPIETVLEHQDPEFSVNSDLLNKASDAITEGVAKVTAIVDSLNSHAAGNQGLAAGAAKDVASQALPVPKDVASALLGTHKTIVGYSGAVTQTYEFIEKLGNVYKYVGVTIQHLKDTYPEQKAQLEEAWTNWHNALTDAGRDSLVGLANYCSGMTVPEVTIPPSFASPSGPGAPGLTGPGSPGGGGGTPSMPSGPGGVPTMPNIPDPAKLTTPNLKGPGTDPSKALSNLGNLGQGLGKAGQQAGSAAQQAGSAAQKALQGALSNLNPKGIGGVPEGALNLGPPGASTHAKGGGSGGGGRGGGGAGPLKAPSPVSKIDGQATTPTKAASAGANASRAGVSGAGTPGAGAPAAGQRGAAVGGGVHKISKALRSTKQGARVTGEGDANVPVIGVESDESESNKTKPAQK